MMTPPAETAAHRMQCLEVWGGNNIADSAVAMAGLDAWVFSRPYGGAEGGGDVHYVSSCATGNVTRMLVADVAGHGDTVAAAAVELRQLMRSHSDFLDQTHFVAELNTRLGGWSADGRFATALASTYYAPTRVLTVSNAGHPPALWYRSKCKEWHYLDAPIEEIGADTNLHNTPLGVLEGAAYGQFEVRLHPGDRVIAYTDSLTESKTPDGRLLGQEGLLSLARCSEVGDSYTFIRRFVETITGLRDGNLEQDDVTILMVEVRDDRTAEPPSGE